MKHQTIHPASPAETHPSMRSPGLHSFECGNCGNAVEYNGKIGCGYQLNDKSVGYWDSELNQDLCSTCESEIYGKDDDA